MFFTYLLLFVAVTTAPASPPQCSITHSALWLYHVPPYFQSLTLTFSHIFSGSLYTPHSGLVPDVHPSFSPFFPHAFLRWRSPPPHPLPPSADELTQLSCGRENALHLTHTSHSFTLPHHFLSSLFPCGLSPLPSITFCTGIMIIIY